MKPTDFKIAGYMAGGISLAIVFSVLFSPFWSQASYFNRCVEYKASEYSDSWERERRIALAVRVCNGWG